MKCRNNDNLILSSKQEHFCIGNNFKKDNNKKNNINF